MLKKRWSGILFLTLATSAFAAPPPASRLPSSINPSRVGSQLSAPTAPSPTTGAVPQPTASGLTTTPGAENVSFVLKSLALQGNTIFTYEQLSPLFQQYLGKEITLADLQKITHAITLKYRDSGYVLSRAIIPAQVIDQGNVTIQIVEGYVKNYHSAGNANGAQNLVDRYGKAVTQSIPLNIDTLERYTLLANDIPGMNQVKAVLQPPSDPDAPLGSTDLEFVPDFSKASGFVGFDNRGTKYLGPNEYNAGGAVNSVLQSGDQWGTQGLASTDWHELNYINAYTVQPLGATGATFNLSGSYSHTNPGYLLSQLDVEGESQEVIGNVQIPWYRTRKQSFYTTLAFDYLNNSSDINLFNTNLYDDRIRSARLAANYYLQDGWKGADQAGIQISQGLPWFNASTVDQPNQSTFMGDPEYTKWNANLTRLQGITNNTSLLVAGIGQYSYDSLLSSEQFAFGGTQYGQAYDPAEIVGDQGVAGKAELRYNQSPGWQYLNNIQYFTYYDIGKVWNILPENQTGVPQIQSAASTGFGVRINFNQYVYGAAEFTQPLTKIVATEGDYAPRIFASITITGKTKSSADQPPPDLGPGPSDFDTPAGYGSGAATGGPVAKAQALGL